MKEISLFTYIKKHIEDDYAMNVLYYSVKKAFAERNFTLHGFSYFFIDGRFLGESLKVTSKGNHRTTIHSLSFLLSLRLLILDHKYLELCNDDNLIIMSKPRESFQWMVYMTLIMDNWDDEEVKMLFGLMEDFYYDEELSEDDKTDFKNSLVCPKYQNERKYYKYLAQKINGISEKIIGNNAFFEADIEKYTISKDIVYVGNTAFSYCENLVSLEFESKVMFGTFPIIECDNLKQIIVPDGLKSYYAECLPYYKSIISEKNSPACENKIEDETNHCDTKRELDDSGVEHVYVGIPSAEPYTETELPSQEIDSKVSSKEERGPIDFSTLQKVFEKKATSYKYFWMNLSQVCIYSNWFLEINYRKLFFGEFYEKEIHIKN